MVYCTSIYHACTVQRWIFRLNTVTLVEELEVVPFHKASMACIKCCQLKPCMLAVHAADQLDNRSTDRLCALMCTKLCVCVWLILSTTHQPTWRWHVLSVDAMDWIILLVIGMEILAHELNVTVHLKWTVTYGSTAQETCVLVSDNITAKYA